MISPLASASGLPCSVVRMSARSSALATIRSNHLRRIFERSLAVSARQAGSAALAASMARFVSAAPMLGTRADHGAVGRVVDVKAAPGIGLDPGAVE